MAKTLEGNQVKKAHAKVAMNDEMVQEFKLCDPEFNHDAPHYFMTHFGHIKHPTKGKMVYIPYEYQVKLIENYHRAKYSISMLGRQMGKALSIHTPIITPNGILSIANLEVGDVVYSGSGLQTRVTNKTDVRKRESMRITFSNGESIIADLDHEWIVKMYGEDEVLTTKELYSDDLYKDVEIHHPYISSGSQHLDIQNIDNMADLPEKLWDYTLKSKHDLIEKFFHLYKENENGREFLHFNNSKWLHLAYSSGFNLIDGRLYRDALGSPVVTYITGIESIGLQDVVCIEVDDPTHTYLAGHTMIPTHNCVVGDTKVTIRHKETGEAIDITMAELEKLLKT